MCDFQKIWKILLLYSELVVRSCEIIMGRIKYMSNRQNSSSEFIRIFYLPVYLSMATTQCPSIEIRVSSKERSGPDDQTPSINKLVRPDNSYSYVIIEINIRYLCNSTKR